MANCTLFLGDTLSTLSCDHCEAPMAAFKADEQAALMDALTWREKNRACPTCGQALETFALERL